MADPGLGADDRSRQLRIAEARYRLMAEHSTDLIYRTNRDGTICWASPSLTDVLGWRQEEFLGHTILDFAHQEDIDRTRDLRDPLYRGEIKPADIPNPAIIRLRTRSGPFRWLSAATTTVPDDLDDGHGLGGLIISLRDVHELVSARDAAMASQAAAERANEEAESAREEAATTRLSMDSAVIGMALTSPAGLFFYVNSALAEMLGYDRAELETKHFGDITHPDDRDLSIAKTKELLAGTSNSFVQRKRYLTKTGGIVWVDLSVAAVRDEQGTVTHFVAQMTDATAEVQAFEGMQRSIRQFRLLAENASDVVYQTDADGMITWISPSVATVLGWDPELLVGTPATALIAPEDAAHDRAPRGTTVRYVTTDGERRWMAVTVKTLPESGHVVGLRDVTDEHRTRQQLARSERRFRLAMDAAPQGMALTDADGRFVDVNPALCALLVATRDELLQRTVNDYLPPAGAPGPQNAMAHHSHYLVTANGDRHIDHAVSAVTGDDGERLFVHQFVDQTAMRDLQDELAQRASRDGLTGVANRHTLLDHLDSVLGEASSVGVLFCDVDGLKTINDTFGHRAGDTVLTWVAEKIGSVLRREDAAGRVGGDEFVVVLTDVDHKDLTAIAEKLQQACTGTVTVDGTVVNVGLSVGAALVDFGETGESVLARADRALYQSKAQGRGRTTVI